MEVLLRAFLCYVCLAVTEARIEILCGEKTLYFTAKKADLNGWQANKIRVGKCRLNGDYSVNADFKKCGLMIAESDQAIEVRTTVLSDKLRSTITRKKPVELIVSCKYNRKKRQSSKVAIKAIVGKIGGYLTRQGKPLDIKLSYVNEQGEVENESNIKKKLGEDVTAMIDGPELKKLGLVASASDCFVSPDSIPDEHSLKHYLLRDMCTEDETLKIERVGTGQRLTFKTFKFAHDEDAFLYLHCDILACTSTSTCGTCIKKWKNISSIWIRNWNKRVRKQMVFDITTIQTLTRANIRCERDGIRFLAKPSDFPRWDGDELFIGTCRLNKNFTGFASYKMCGIKGQERRHQVIMTTNLVGSSSESGRITRKRPVKYTIRCGYDRFLTQSSNFAVETFANNEVAKEPHSLFLQLIDQNGFPFTKHVLEVAIDEKVEAVIGGSNLAKSNVYVYATDCYVTPSEDADDAQRHDLLVSSCPVDPTFSISRYGNGQKLSFHSFAFVHDHDAKLYLHCDIIACLPQSTCGVCNNGGRKGGSSGGRKKRNVPFKKIRRLDANALLTRA